MRLKSFIGEMGVERIVGIVISELTYEEYIRMGIHLDDSYLSLRDVLFRTYTARNMNVRYHYKKSKQLAIEQVEKYRNDKSRIAFYNFIENVKKYLLV